MRERDAVASLRSVVIVEKLDCPKSFLGKLRSVHVGESQLLLFTCGVVVAYVDGRGILETRGFSLVNHTHHDETLRLLTVNSICFSHISYSLILYKVAIYISSKLPFFLQHHTRTHSC